jgi:hypothetical protein
LAERIEAAIEVLNDIHYSQLFHHDEDATTRDVVPRGLIHVIQSDVARLREEFAAAVDPCATGPRNDRRETEGTGAALGEARRPNHPRLPTLACGSPASHAAEGTGPRKSRGQNVLVGRTSAGCLAREPEAP